jgi:chromate transporter
MMSIAVCAKSPIFILISSIQNLSTKFSRISTKLSEIDPLKMSKILDGIVLGQVTPGPILITATFIGYKLSWFLGACMTTLGIFFPSFFILVLLIPYYDRLKGVKIVQTMERGILGSFIGMLGLVLYNFGRTTLVDIPNVILAGAAFFALLKKVSLPYILLLGGVLSIPLSFLSF